MGRHAGQDRRAPTKTRSPELLGWGGLAGLVGGVSAGLVGLDAGLAVALGVGVAACFLIVWLLPSAGSPGARRDER